VLFGGEAGERVKDVGVMGGPFLDGPIFHGGGHDIGRGGIQGCAFLDGGDDGFINRFGQALLHDAYVKYVRCE
jgi:hypothetical protein